MCLFSFVKYSTLAYYFILKIMVNCRRLYYFNRFCWYYSETARCRTSVYFLYLIERVRILLLLRNRWTLVHRSPLRIILPFLNNKSLCKNMWSSLLVLKIYAPSLPRHIFQGRPVDSNWFLWLLLLDFWRKLSPMMYFKLTSISQFHFFYLF